MRLLVLLLLALSVVVDARRLGHHTSSSLHGKVSNEPTVIHPTAAELKRAEASMEGSFGSNVKGWFKSIFKLDGEKRRRHGSNVGNFVTSYFSNLGSNFMFPYMNYVRGFHQQGVMAWIKRKIPFHTSLQEDDRFKAPVKGDKIGVVGYGKIAENKGWGDVVDKYPYFKNYYTGAKIPQNEDNENHAKGIGWLDAGMSFSEKIGHDPIKILYEMEPRIAYEKETLIKVTWDGFSYVLSPSLSLSLLSAAHFKNVTPISPTLDTLDLEISSTLRTVCSDGT